MLMSVLSFLQEAPFKPSIFGEDLELIISLPSHCDNGLKIPKIVPFLADAVLKMNGLQSEGIFRVPGDAEEVTDLVCLFHCIGTRLMLTTLFIACSDWKWQLWFKWHYRSQCTSIFTQILASRSWKTINTHRVVWWMRQVCREFRWSHRHCQRFTRSKPSYCYVHDRFCSGKWIHVSSMLLDNSWDH